MGWVEHPHECDLPLYVHGSAITSWYFECDHCHTVWTVYGRSEAETEGFYHVSFMRHKSLATEREVRWANYGNVSQD